MPEAPKDDIKFPFFAFHLSEVPDEDSDTGKVEIPVMRLWLSRERFYDLNIDGILGVLDAKKDKTAMSVEIFNNEESRNIVFIYNNLRKTIEYYISYAYSKIKTPEDVEMKGARSLANMAFDLTEFMNLYKDWLQSQFDENGKNINAK